MSEQKRILFIYRLAKFALLILISGVPIFISLFVLRYGEADFAGNLQIEMVGSVITFIVLEIVFQTFDNLLLSRYQSQTESHIHEQIQQNRRMIEIVMSEHRHEINQYRREFMQIYDEIRSQLKETHDTAKLLRDFADENDIESLFRSISDVTAGINSINATLQGGPYHTYKGVINHLHDNSESLDKLKDLQHENLSITNYIYNTIAKGKNDDKD
ncbi:hypothetical protein G4Y79_18645 [Phototrophicus methaneseepsis]|uniref:Uncharacterized protein n=1 Tax=Phototrophicus methaneseepsis TaxID=2710758 RepID=A0A7S8ICL9_9CHLR|nr:hypothetical protein [Phototrophicus methaneseepsis]QPC81690.1 hypothetical protein G4Y79_18645 [Phototrophicus methaneseepsis]